MELAALQILLYSTLALVCRAFPADANSGTVTGASSNSFGVNSCRKLPSTRDMNVCSIDYQVPASIAAMANIIEYHINGKLMETSELPGSDNCRPHYLEAMCAFYFPRCEGPNVVMSSMPNCAQRTSTCHSFVRRLITAEGICSLNATAPLDSCDALSQYEAYDNFQRCSVVDGSTEVTAWMVEYMKTIDREWTQKLTENSQVSSLGQQTSCSQGISRYYCQFYGKCTNNGEIKLSNSEGFCDGVLECYTDMTAESLRNTISCSLWPLVDPPPPTTSTPSEPSPQATSTSSSSSSVVQQPSKWPNPIIDGGISLHRVYLTGISFIALTASILLL